MALSFLPVRISVFVGIPFFAALKVGPFGELIRARRGLGVKYRRALFRLEGKVQGVTVKVRSSTRDASNHGQSPKLEVRAPCASGFTLRPEGVLDGLRPVDSMSGDADCDSALWFTGDPVRVAALDASARRWLETRIGSGAWMSDGVLAVNDICTPACQSTS